MNATPRWFLPTAIVALLWNLLGCMAYLADMRMTAAQIAELPPVQQQMLAMRPGWAVAAYALAVWGGALGSLGLVLRKRWALPVLIVSLLAIVVQDYALFVLADAVSAMGIVPLVLQTLVLLIAVGLVLMARKGVQLGWLT